MNEVREKKAGHSRRNRSQSDHPNSFPFFFRDWLSDPDVRALGHDRRGRLLDSLCFTWGTTRTGMCTEDQLRSWLGYSAEEWPEHRDAFLAIWRPRRDGMLVQKRALRLRAEQKRRWKASSENGKKGGRKSKEHNGVSRVGFDLAQPTSEPTVKPIPLQTKPESLSLRAKPLTPEAVGACRRGTGGSQTISEILGATMARHAERAAAEADA